MPAEWWTPLRNLNDQYFAGPSSAEGWQAHVDRLNEEYGLLDADALSTLPDPQLPPSWFIGDVTSVKPGNWVLVFSLNPQMDNPLDSYFKIEDSESFWKFQIDWFEDRVWNPYFHLPLAALSSVILGSPIEMGNQAFAGESMVFVELCPFASQRFVWESALLQRLVRHDVACQIEAQMVSIMLNQGRPRLVMVNGNAAIECFEAVYGDGLVWKDVPYESWDRPRKRLWHKQGMLMIEDRGIPVVGFPFLRRARTHNSYAEIEQLGSMIRDHVSSLGL